MFALRRRPTPLVSNYTKAKQRSVQHTRVSLPSVQRIPSRQFSTRPSKSRDPANEWSPSKELAQLIFEPQEQTVQDDDMFKKDIKEKLLKFKSTDKWRRQVLAEQILEDKKRKAEREDADELKKVEDLFANKLIPPEENWRTLKFDLRRVNKIDELADWNEGHLIRQVRKDPPAFSAVFHKMIERAVNERRYKDAITLYLDMCEEKVPRLPATLSLILEAIEKPDAQRTNFLLLLQKLAEDNIPLDKHLYHRAISSAYQNQQYDSIIQIWEDLRRDKIAPHPESAKFVANVALLFEKPDVCDSVISHMVESEVPLTSDILDAAAILNYKLGNQERVNEILQLYNKFNVQPGFGGLTVIAETNALKGNLKAAIAAKNAIYRLGRNKNPLMRTYNMLLTALLEADKYQEAEKIIQELRTLKITPPENMLRTLLLYFCDTVNLHKVNRYWNEYHVYGYRPDEKLYDAYMDALYASHATREFMKAFKNVMENNWKPTRRQWTRRLLLLAESATEIDDVVTPFQAITRAGFELTREDYAIMLTAYARFKDHQAMLDLLENEMRPNGYDFDLFEWNLLLRVYVKVGEWSNLITTFERMLQNNIPVDINSFVSAMRACKEVGSLYTLQKYLAILETRISKIKVDDISLSMIIRYCAEMDDIYSAEKVWALTEKHYPDQLKEHAFAEMIAISSHHRSWTDVMDLYNRMKAGNIVRDNKVYAFVLKSLAIADSEALATALQVMRDYMNDTTGVKYISKRVVAFFLLKVLRHGSDDAFDEALLAMQELNKPVFLMTQYKFEHDQVPIDFIPVLTRWVNNELTESRLVPPSPIERPIDFISSYQDRTAELEKALNGAYAASL